MPLLSKDAYLCTLWCGRLPLTRMNWDSLRPSHRRTPVRLASSLAAGVNVPGQSTAALSQS